MNIKTKRILVSLGGIKPYFKVNKKRGIPEPLWGSRIKGITCRYCGFKELYFSAHPDDPEEIFNDLVRCKVCGHYDSDIYDEHFNEYWMKNQ